MVRIRRSRFCFGDFIVQVRWPSQLSIKSSREVIAKNRELGFEEFGQFGDIHSNPSRLILAEQVGRSVRRSGPHAHESELFDT
jgi:hypothetical protein